MNENIKHSFVLIAQEFNDQKHIKFLETILVILGTSSTIGQYVNTLLQLYQSPSVY